MGFCYHSKKDYCRLYNALFSLNTLPCLLYLGGIFINTFSSRSTYTNALTTLNYSILRSNLAISISKTRKKIITKVVALVDKL